MSQNSDIDRLAAALGRPGLRYHSFGNGPTRTEPASAGAEAAPEAVPEQAVDLPPRDAVIAQPAPPPDSAPPDSAPPSGPPAPPPRSLLEHLRSEAVAQAAPGEGLLALLSHPAVWDRPPEAAPPPLAGRPISPVAAPPSVPSAAQPEAMPPAAAPAPPIAGMPLAAMFRLVGAPPTAATRTDPLPDLLRGLRSGRPG